MSGAILQAQRSAPAIAIVRMQAELDWDKETQGTVLSAFFVGYMTMQIPAGLCTHRLGPHRLIGLAVVFASLMSLLLPVAASHSADAVFFCRLAQGLAQGLWSPSLAGLWARWAPPAERSRIDSFPQVGQYFGTLTLGALAGWQCDNPAGVGRGGLGWLLGWQGTYRLHGALGLAWAVVWFWFAESSPRAAVRCPQAEVDEIEQALAAEAAEAAAPGTRAPGDKQLLPRGEADEEDAVNEGGLGSGPLGGLELAKAVGGAGCVWALMVVHASANWSQFILDDGLPGYLRDVLGLSLATAGLLASLPAALKLGFTLAAASSADYLRGSSGPDWATTVRVRKFFAMVSIAPQMLMLLFLSGGGAAGSPTLVMLILILCDGLTGLASGGGYSVNHLDVAPHLAGAIQGLKNACGQLMGVAAPLAIGYLTPYPNALSREQMAAEGREPSAEWLEKLAAEWRLLFFLTAMINLVGLLVYLRLGRGTRQWWDKAAASK
jgi:MFS family permease